MAESENKAGADYVVNCYTTALNPANDTKTPYMEE